MVVSTHSSWLTQFAEPWAKTACERPLTNVGTAGSACAVPAANSAVTIPAMTPLCMRPPIALQSPLSFPCAGENGNRCCGEMSPRLVD